VESKAGRIGAGETQCDSFIDKTFLVKAVAFTRLLRAQEDIEICAATVLSDVDVGFVSLLNFVNPPIAFLQ
jgi:hypothetical protein